MAAEIGRQEVPVATILQIILNHVDFGMSLPAALAAPRVSQTNCQRPSCGGSGPLSVMGSVGEQDALAQKVGFRSSVHLSFDHFYAVDVAFDDAGAVGQGEAGGDGGPVLAQAFSKAA